MSISFNQDIGTVTIQKRKFAVNLLWSTSETRDEFKKNIKLETEQIGTDLFCEFKNDDNSICYGLADSALGHAVGMPVLPAMLALSLEYPLLGAWRLDTNFWYVLAIDETRTIIIDKAFDSEDAAFESFCSSLNDIKWREVICPEVWEQSQRTGDFSLDDLPRKRLTKIKYSKLKLRRFHFIGAGLLLVFTILGLIAKSLLQQPVYSIPEINSPVKKHNVFPAKEFLRPKDFITECRDDIFNYIALAFSVPGYSVDKKITCNNSGVTFRLTRLFGSTDYIPDSLSENINNYGGKLNIENEDSVTIHFPFNGEFIGDLGSAAIAASSRDKIVRSFDNTFLKAVVEQERKCGEESTDKIKFDRQFECVDFKINFKYNPRILIPVFDQYTGSVITDVFYDASNSDWSIDGTVYGVRDKT
ncbi:hypothetical protein [Yokenella regensburgei]|uniref:hypothetical protein n=1 Tax=Yokenella regensburgei TaxID=158877 RepID=UPI00143344DB|nr:hypothetical protein [Yokenella regensburgei]QIU90100.1 hypothetical protein HEC60_12670 [Yokenella regensburgei]